MAKIPVAILGATGAVGQRFISLLNQHPWFEVTEVVASDRSAGMTYGEATRWVLDGYPPMQVASLEVKSIDAPLEAPLVFSALPSETAYHVEPQLAARGHLVCSNASAYRMDADVPLVIPEINPEHIELIEVQRRQRNWTGAIVTNSNCTSMPLTIALAPLRQFHPTRLHVVSMQAISGAGYPGVSALDIFDNVIPYIKNEEDKLKEEPRKMLGYLNGETIERLDVIISAACNRVPVIDGHLVSIAVHLKTHPTLNEIHNAWREFRGNDIVRALPSAPHYPIEIAMTADRPQPRRDREAGNGMTTVVGRLRECEALDGVEFVALSHNTIRGAAGGSILNAELLVKMGYVTHVENLMTEAQLN